MAERQIADSEVGLFVPFGYRKLTSPGKFNLRHHSRVGVTFKGRRFSSACGIYFQPSEADRQTQTASTQ